MNTTKIIEALLYCVPAIITGCTAYYFFKTHTDNEESRRRYLLFKDTNKDTLPLKLQAYERMSLFLERTNPIKLVLRVAPQNDNKELYENLLIQTIDQEFEHNLTQQIYISDEAWQVIIRTKNSIIANIRIATQQVGSAKELREKILSDIAANESELPSNLALLFIKNEVKNMIG
nr:hypothetical protein [uncultured Flavobacterium sp.]